MNNTEAIMASMIDKACFQLMNVPQEKREEAPEGGKWTRKEILGHLIDSAANHHQYFVRAQLTNNLSFPGFEQNDWVACQQYRNEAWGDLVQLWQSYNRRLSNVIAVIPEERLKNRCSIRYDEPITLKLLIVNYLRHMRHHLNQILDSELGGFQL